MRRNNVGGQRIYATSPEVADIVAISQNIIGIFNDGMDRLNRERMLTDSERNILYSLPPDSALQLNYDALSNQTHMLWELALEKQRSFHNHEVSGPYSIEELGNRLIECSQRWEVWKNRLRDYGSQ